MNPSLRWILMAFVAFGIGLASRVLSRSGSQGVAVAAIPEASAGVSAADGAAEDPSGAGPEKLGVLGLLEGADLILAVAAMLGNCSLEDIEGLVQGLLLDRQWEDWKRADYTNKGLLEFMLLTRWGELDHAAAFEFAREHAVYGGREHVYAGWGAVDFAAALRHARAEGETGGLVDLLDQLDPKLAEALERSFGVHRERAGEFAFGAVPAAGAADPPTNFAAGAAELLARPFSQSRSRGVKAHVASWAERDADAALGWARGALSGPDRRSAIAEIAAAVAVTDPAWAIELMGEVGWVAGREKTMRAIAESDAELAVRTMEEEDFYVAGLFGSWARRDPDTALAWLREHPGRAEAREIPLPDDLETARALVDSLPESPSLEARLAGHWAMLNPDAAAAWLLANERIATDYDDPFGNDRVDDPFAEGVGDGADDETLAARIHNDRLEAIFVQLLDTDVSLAMAAAEHIGDPNWINRVIDARARGGGDPAEVLRWLEAAADGVDNIDWDRVIDWWLPSDPAAVGEWVSAQTEPSRIANGGEAMVAHYTDRGGVTTDFHAALEWARWDAYALARLECGWGRIEDPFGGDPFAPTVVRDWTSEDIEAEKAESIGQVIESWVEYDPAAARRVFDEWSARFGEQRRARLEKKFAEIGEGERE